MEYVGQEYQFELALLCVLLMYHLLLPLTLGYYFLAFSISYALFLTLCVRLFLNVNRYENKNKLRACDPNVTRLMDY
jgi:hypothetical protein